MYQTAHSLYDTTAKQAVRVRVEKDIVTIKRKITALEKEPRRNDQLLAAYRHMLKTRTDVLECLTQQ